MQDNVGIVRTESEMQYALGQLQQLKRARIAPRLRAIANTIPVGIQPSI